MLTSMLQNKNCLKPSPETDILELKAMNILSELSENDLHFVGSSNCEIKKSFKQKQSYIENFNFSPWVQSQKENLQQKPKSLKKKSVTKTNQKRQNQLHCGVKMVKNLFLKKQKHLQCMNFLNQQLKGEVLKPSELTENKQTLNTMEIEAAKNKRKNVCQIIKSFLNLSTSIVYSHSSYPNKQSFKKTKNISEGFESFDGLEDAIHKKRLSSKTINVHLNIQTKQRSRRCFQKGISSKRKKALPSMNSRETMSRKELGMTFETQSSIKDRFYPSEYISSNPLTRRLYTKYIDSNSRFPQYRLDKNLSEGRR